MTRKNKWMKPVAVVLLLLIFGVSFYILTTGLTVQELNAQKSELVAKKQAEESKKQEQEEESDLPKVSSSDWNLILVNREHPTEELGIELAVVENLEVDARIADAVTNFLAAARTVETSEVLVSGYRSVALQAELYEQYVQQEMAEDPSLTREAAETLVQTYAQPAGASEHHTGLAIDMSNSSELNTSSEEVVAKIKALAPEYGFVLRFEADKTASTGIGYEDWHWRYVGVESAKYMTEHNLSLEEYIALLQEQEKK